MSTVKVKEKIHPKTELRLFYDPEQQYWSEDVKIADTHSDLGWIST